MTPWIFVLLSVLLTLGTALFVAVEFSLVALDRPSVARAAESGDTGAKAVLASLRRLSTQLSAAQVGITLTTLVFGYLTAPGLGRLLETPLAAFGLSGTALTSTASTVALALATVFSMVFGELVPQFLGISAPLGTAKVVVRPVQLFSVVAKPLIWVLNGSANAFVQMLGIEPQEELSSARTPQELSSLVRRSAEAGTLDSGTALLVTKSLSFGDQTAADVMSPRMKCVAIDRTASAHDLVQLARSSGHSRFPVLGADWDDIDGIVHVKRALGVPHERRHDVPVSALMTEALLVPETVRLDPLMLQLRESGFQLAVVVDEYGGTSGVVTLEDVVEEIVGEVADEHDRTGTTGRELRDGRWSVPGLWRPDEVRERVGADIPDGPAYETVGGWLMAALGRVPEVGDVVELPEWVVTVTDMDGRRVDRLRFTPVETDGESPEVTHPHVDPEAGGATAIVRTEVGFSTGQGSGVAEAARGAAAPGASEVPDAPEARGSGGADRAERHSSSSSSASSTGGEAGR